MPASGSRTADLSPGDHLCLIYETGEEHRDALTPFLRGGLEQGERVLCILSHHPPERILSYLREDGLDPRPYLDRGQLVLLASDAPSRNRYSFDLDRVADFLQLQVDRALEEGYAALRIACEMEQTPGDAPALGRLAEYEAELHRFLEMRPCLALCLYDRRRFPPELLLNILRSHPLVVVGAEVRENGYYISPERAADELDRWMSDLRGQLAAIHGMGRELALARDERRIAETVVEMARRFLAFQVCGLWLVDPKERRLVRAAHAFDKRPLEITSLPLDAEQGIIPLVARTGEPVYLADAHKDPRYLDPGLGFRSELCVPLKLGHEVLGVLNAESRQVAGFDETDRQMFSLLADYAALALANARLHQDALRRAEGLATVAEVAEQIESILDLDRLLQDAVERIVERLGYDYAAIMLLDEEAGDLVFQAGAGEFAGRTPPGFRQKLEEGMIGWVATHGEILLANDVSQEPRYIPAYISDTRSELDVPLKVRGRVIGVLDLQSSQLNAFDQHDVLVLEALAGHLAVAVENARLFQEEQRRRQEAETLRELGALLTSTMDLDQILKLLLDRLDRLVTYDRATVMLLEDGALQVVAARGYEVMPDGEEVVGYRVPLAEDPLLAKVVEQGKVVWVADATTDPRWYAEPRWPTTSWIGVPLMVRGLVIGMVSVARAELPRFTLEDAYLVRAVADHAAVAIENGRLYQKLRVYATELEERVQEQTAELRRERERIQAILDHAGQGVIVVDARGVIQYMNPAAEAIVGCSASESVGKMPAVWGGEVEPGDFFREMWQAVRSGQVWRGEFSHRRKDGTRYDGVMTVAPIPGGEGGPAGFVGIVEDITALKELDRLKTRFVSDAAHELRTPVTTIKLYVSLLQQERREEKRAEYMEMLARETDLMVQLVQDLLDISRMEAGVARFEPEPLDLNGLAQEVVERYEERARQGEIALSFEPALGLPSVMADREQMDRVLTNLVVNALNYTPAGGRVVVRTGLADDRVEVAVVDTGYGIPEEEQKHIFERFFRGSAARKSEAPGTGLGLSIVYEILEMHGGRIEVESQVGKGSTFTFWLPIGDLEF